MLTNVQPDALKTFVRIIGDSCTGVCAVDLDVVYHECTDARNHFNQHSDRSRQGQGLVRNVSDRAGLLVAGPRSLRWPAVDGSRFAWE